MLYLTVESKTQSTVVCSLEGDDLIWQTTETQFVMLQL